MYLSGIPAGMLVDSKGPRPAIMIGAVSMFVGYYPIYLGMVSRSRRAGGFEAYYG